MLLRGLNRLRKKAHFAHEMPEEHTSAAKAGLILLALCRG